MSDFAFTTDGCSGGMTMLWRLVSRNDPPWNDLCVEHDRAYWAGGTAEMRRQADRALMAGVVLNGHPVWAFLMWAGVRMGGHPLLPTSWRWGYGYRFPKRYDRAVAGAAPDEGRAMRVKCFWVEMIEPRVDDWEGGIGRPRYRRLDTGEELRGELPAGALYIADPGRKYNYSRGHDGEAVVCVLPDGDHWHIDSFANNCTKPDDKEHRCWVRHGSKPGVIHVDKNGLTCSAGGGSIATKAFHGFLHNGELYSC